MIMIALVKDPAATFTLNFISTNIVLVTSIGQLAFFSAFSFRIGSLNGKTWTKTAKVK